MHYFTRLVRFNLAHCRGLLALAGALALGLGPMMAADMDMTFLPAVDPAFAPDVNGGVRTIAVQPDGKVLIGGLFTDVGPVNRPYLARLNPDGTLDGSFDPQPDNTVSSIVVQPDGKIIAGGGFKTVGGRAQKYIARLNPDGTLDPSFDPLVDNIVIAMALLADGRIMVLGVFRTIDGVPNNYICRLLPNGNLDPTFVSPLGFEFGLSVESVAVRPDGKLIIGGEFMAAGGTETKSLARLHPDGSFDTDFSAQLNSGVLSVSLQPDGRILAGGRFSASRGEYFYNYMRLSASGEPDHSFKPDPYGGVVTISLQADGESLIGGGFASLTPAEVRRDQLARINTEGVVDPRFDIRMPNVASIGAIALQADGKLLIAGNFTSVGGQPRRFLARVLNDPVVDTLTIEGALIEWQRGGSAPEAVHTTFDFSTDGGASWNRLGDGIRTPGGWQLPGVTLPGSGLVRARAAVRSGYANGSMGLVESIQPFPRVTTTPVSIGVGLMADRSIRVNFTGSPGNHYTVMASSDLLLPLAAWTVLGAALEVSTGQYEFIDLTAGSGVRRFYLIRSP